MKFIHSLFFTFCLLISANSAFAQSEVFANEDKVALKGYDVVAYHNAYAAIRGTNAHTVEVEGFTYYFSNAENQKAFKENPSAYLPEYGGYCAFAMAMQGAKVPVDPQTFKLRDGKLYLFFNDYYEGKPINTIIPWNGSEVEMITKANTNWSGQ